MSRHRRDSGSGSLYKRSKDGLWVGAVVLGYGADGKMRRKVVASKSRNEAVRKLAALRAQVDARQDVSTKAITVAAWFDIWLNEIAAPRVRPRTLDTYRGYVARYVVPVIGRRRLDSVQPQHIRQVHTEIISAGLSTTTARQAHAIIVRSFRDARREGYVCIDVGDRMDPPRIAASDRTALTVDQAVTLLRSVKDDPLGPRWATALLLGARQGECLGLEWDRVNFATGVIDLSWQLQRIKYRHGCGIAGNLEDLKGLWSCGKTRAGWCPNRELDVPAGFEVREIDGSGLVLTRPKSRAGKRLVPMIPALAMALDSLPRVGPLVFTRPDGHPIDPKDDSPAWHRALDAAGLPSVPLHAARHTTATLLRAGGVDMKTIGDIVGHSSAAVTDAYLHNDLTLARAAMEGLGRMLALDAVEE